MKDYKRKDKLFITVVALACLIMVIANPHEYSIRDLAWNYALLLLFSSAVLWFAGELSDLWSSFVFRMDSYEGFRKERYGVHDFSALSREQLIEMAGNVIKDKNILNGLSDDQLARLIMTNGGGVPTKKKGTAFGFLVKIYKTLRFVCVSLRILIIKLARYLREAKKSMKGRKPVEHKPMTLEELEEERAKLMRELSDG
jgi:hypothetical protein